MIVMNTILSKTYKLINKMKVKIFGIILLLLISLFAAEDTQVEKEPAEEKGKNLRYLSVSTLGFCIPNNSNYICCVGACSGNLCVS